MNSSRFYKAGLEISSYAGLPYSYGSARAKELIVSSTSCHFP